MPAGCTGGGFMAEMQWVEVLRFTEGSTSPANFALPCECPQFRCLPSLNPEVK